MTTLCLIADDLTGALDSAAGFAPALGPLHVGWGDMAGGAGSLVVNSATREGTPEAAAARLAALAPLLAPAPGRISFFKLDSLLRGHGARELAAILAVQSFDHVVIAPALPFQGRITRGGRQMVRGAAGWQATGEDLAAALHGLGWNVQTCAPWDGCPPGISLWDAETDADLAGIAAAADRAGGSVLYVGSAGLANALANRLPAKESALPMLEAPLLGLIGTDHPVMLGQLAAIPGHHRLLGREGAVDLREDATFLTCALPPGLSRGAAQTEIAARFAAVMARVPRPGSLFVSGGETLAALCPHLGVAALAVCGAREPGLPLSRLVGGPWDGLPLLSRSGAFGPPDFFSTLVASLPPRSEGS